MNIAEKLDPFGMPSDYYDAMYNGEEYHKADIKPIQRPNISDSLKAEIDRERAKLKAQIKEENIERQNKLNKLVEEVGDIFNIPKDEVKIPLPTHTDIIKGLTDKEYIVVGALSMLSNFDDDKRGEQNYIYRNKVDDTLNNLSYVNTKGKEASLSKRVVDRYIKKLETDFSLVETVETPHGVAYKINYATDKKYYTTIPFIQLKELVTSTNSNMLKLFTVLSYQLSTTEYKEMDRWYLCGQVGYPTTSTKYLDMMGTMVRSLANLGFITILEKKVQHKDEKTGRKSIKTHYSYRLNTLEEYIEAKNRGIIKQ